MYLFFPEIFAAAKWKGTDILLILLWNIAADSAKSKLNNLAHWRPALLSSKPREKPSPHRSSLFTSLSPLKQWSYSLKHMDIKYFNIILFYPLNK